TSLALAAGNNPGGKWYNDFQGESGDWTLFGVRYFCTKNDLQSHREEWLENACRFFGKEEA
ncbi:MAG: hypothetical protein J6R85_00920, partial [Lentisphaeria bacterium]|nr:hypothetical protein [Lentisphaeria bacterium]